MQRLDRRSFAASRAVAGYPGETLDPHESSPPGYPIPQLLSVSTISLLPIQKDARRIRESPRIENMVDHSA